MDYRTKRGLMRQLVLVGLSFNWLPLVLIEDARGTWAPLWLAMVWSAMALMGALMVSMTIGWADQRD